MVKENSLESYVINFFLIMKCTTYLANNNNTLYYNCIIITLLNI